MAAEFDLRHAIEAAIRHFATAALLSGRDGLLPTPQESARADDGDWELVTWLVVLASPTAAR